MKSDSDPLLDVAAAVADGTDVDWDHAINSATSDEERRVLAELQFIAGVVRDGRAAFTDIAANPLVGASDAGPASDTWGPLRILERVGGGTFGDVFRAWDRRLDREVALKILRQRSNSADRDFIEEGRLLARVQHPNIVTVYGAERIDGHAGVWMEFIAGQTLEEELRDRGPFDVDEVIAIGMRLADALAAAHHAGLIHGDVKAQNVIRNRGGEPVLTDFGAGCVLDEASDDAARELAGTPLCAAPEVLAGGPATPQSDIYSLGVLLYHLATGSYPVTGGSLNDIREAHATDRRLALRAVRADLPETLTRIIDGALAPDRHERCPSADTLRAALTALSDNRRSDTARPAPPRMRRPITAIMACLAGIVALATVWFTRGTEPPAIVVLPLKNISTEANAGEFVDGLTGEIIRNLGEIEGLAVRSQTSSFAFRDKPRDLREVGRLLHADFVVEGSVFRAGDKLRVTAQLVRVADDTPIWSGRFDRALTDVFAIQDEISRSIVNGLRLKLGRGQRRYTTNPQTYDLYIRARARLNEASSLNLAPVREAIDRFEQVVAQDPAFAPAYAGLTEAWAKSSNNYFGVSAAEGYARMRAAAEQALQLDPLLAEAHAAMGLVFARDLEWARSEDAFRRAIALNQNLPFVYESYAVWTLFPQGKLEEALRQLTIALRTDPGSIHISALQVYLQISAGQYDAAIAGAQRVLASSDPEGGGVKQFLARALAQKGRTTEALQVVDGLGSGVDNIRGYTYAITGRRAEAEALALRNAGYPGRQAFIYAGLHDTDRAFAALDAMITDKDPRAGSYLTFPEFASLRSDPRFAHLRERLLLRDR